VGDGERQRAEHVVTFGLAHRTLAPLTPSELNYDPPLRKRTVERVLKEMIRYGAPRLRHADEEAQSSFDTTCEMFRRFLGKATR